MHLTPTELDVLPNIVAAIAIIGGYIGVRSANRSQLRLSHETYQRDRLTETYLDMLKGVHLRDAQLDDSYYRPMAKPSRTPQVSEFDPTTDDETLFAARLLAYASPEIDELWGKFAHSTTEFDNLLIALRQSTGVAPADLKGDERRRIEGMFDQWRQIRDDLKEEIRKELRKPAL
jgi:hypothetical protein